MRRWMTFVELLQHTFMKSGLTVEDISTMTGLDRDMLSNLLEGSLDQVPRDLIPDGLGRLMDVLGMTVGPPQAVEDVMATIARTYKSKEEVTMATDR